MHPLLTTQRKSTTTKNVINSIQNFILYATNWNQIKLSRLLLFVVVVISFILSNSQILPVDAVDSSNQEEKSLWASGDQEEQVDKLISSIEPRQYFKINITPSSIGNNNKNEPVKKIRVAKGQPSNSRRSAAQEVSSSSKPERDATNQKLDKKMMTGNKQKNISNATLKKLLNQSLLKGLNGTSSSSIKQPNFKFVFIQRATAAPDKDKEKEKDKKLSSSPETSSNSQSTITRTPETTTKAPVAAQSSLAASVSKQLASSLLSSAVNYVGNMNSSSSSLSSLASQIVAHSLSLDKTKEDSNSPDKNSITKSGETSPDQTDIKRVNNKEQATTTTKGFNYDNKRKSSASTTSTSKTKRPSKIYNLPVKFVSNGQPNMIVFNTIRQHFATIKKLQQATAKLHSNIHNNSSSKYANNNNKHKRPMFSNGQKGLKGANSRLIYLPLKYLSNARPNKILISKATHKSNS